MIRQFTSKTQQLGLLGEENAVVFLMKQGFDVLERNINGRYGEIDIVAKKSSVYHFFEVKTGKAGNWFNPAENLTKEKLRKFQKTVQYYVMIHGIKNYRLQGIVVFLNERNDSESTIEIFDLS
jgi:putative endonuclease